MTHPPMRACLILLLTLLLAPPAHAIIKIDLPVAKLYQRARTVVVGQIAQLDAARQILDVTVGAPLKGNLGAGQFTLQLAAQADLLRGLKPGAPVALLVSQGPSADSILHLADTWLQVRPSGAGATAWQVTQDYPGAVSFPGRTAALCRLLADLQAGKPSLQDWISHEAFLQGIADRGNLNVTRPTFLLAADLSADGLFEVIVGAHEGVKLFERAGKLYEDRTDRWGLASARARTGAVGDLTGDGQPDLLLEGTIWARAGDRFTPTKAALNLSDPAAWLAVTIADATGDDRPDVVVLLPDGRLHVRTNPGTPDGQWKPADSTLWSAGPPAAAAVFSREFGDDGRLHVIVVRDSQITRFAIGTADPAPADFRRLTGLPLADYPYLGQKPLQVLVAAAVDYEGNNKTDFLLVTTGGGVTLANRGHGAFLINRFVHDQFHPESTLKGLPKLKFEPAPGTLTAPGFWPPPVKGKRNRQDLFLLRPDGQLFEMLGQARTP